jgi:hypothetical protein
MAVTIAQSSMGTPDALDRSRSTTSVTTTVTVAPDGFICLERQELELMHVGVSRTSPVSGER